MQLFIYGKAAPQGSKRIVKRGSRTLMLETSKFLPAWRTQVKLTAQRAKPQGWSFKSNQPIILFLDFRIPRFTKTQSPYAISHRVGDLSKLQRAVEDGLVDAKLIPDDSRVVHAFTSKRYVNEEERAGVHVRIVLLDDETFEQYITTIDTLTQSHWETLSRLGE